jgi:hypothetical protein
MKSLPKCPQSREGPGRISQHSGRHSRSISKLYRPWCTTTTVMVYFVPKHERNSCIWSEVEMTKHFVVYRTVCTSLRATSGRQGRPSAPITDGRRTPENYLQLQLYAAYLRSGGQGEPHTTAKTSMTQIDLLGVKKRTKVHVGESSKTNCRNFHDLSRQRNDIVVEFSCFEILLNFGTKAKLFQS